MARRTPSGVPEFQGKQFTIPDIRRYIPRLEQQVQVLEGLVKEEVDWNDVKLTAVSHEFRASIGEVFGMQSSEYHDCPYDLNAQHYIDNDYANQQDFIQGCQRQVEVLRAYIARLQQKERELEAETLNQWDPYVIGKLDSNVQRILGQISAARSRGDYYLVIMAIRPLIELVARVEGAEYEDISACLDYLRTKGMIEKVTCETAKTVLKRYGDLILHPWPKTVGQMTQTDSDTLYEHLKNFLYEIYSRTGRKSTVEIKAKIDELRQNKQ